MSTGQGQELKSWEEAVSLKANKFGLTMYGGGVREMGGTRDSPHTALLSGWLGPGVWGLRMEVVHLPTPRSSWPGAGAAGQGPPQAPTDCTFSFQILGAVILGFGVWILADKSSFISVLRKGPSP